MKVVIAGGGVAGLAAAAALTRVGVDAVVLEAAPAISARGGVHVWANGTRAMGSLGVSMDLERPLTRRAEFRSVRGGLIAAWDVAARQAQMGAATLGVDRGEIVERLLGLLGEDVVRLGHRCVGYSEEGGRVVAHVEGGGREVADVLIGADGAASAIATQLAGGAPARRRELTAWCGTAHPERPPAARGTLCEWWEPGRRFVCYETAEGTWAWTLIDYARADGTFVGWSKPVQELVAATPPSERQRTSASAAPPQRRWGIGCVTLLGDAAHPMGTGGGQGVSLALEDALALPRHLGAASDPVRGLRAYERERRRRTAPQQRLAARLDALGALDGRVGCAARERFMRLTWERVGFRGLVRDVASTAG